MKNSSNIHGGHAEYLIAFAEGTVLLPDELSYEQAAPIFCAGYTVWSAIRMAKPQIGERIAVLGIGGLGHLALQYAKSNGRAMIMGIDHNALILPWRLIAPQIQVMAVQHGPRAYLYEALEYAAKGKVRVLVEEFSLDQIEHAYKRVANGEIRFRAVIKPRFI